MCVCTPGAGTTTDPGSSAVTRFVKPARGGGNTLRRPCGSAVRSIGRKGEKPSSHVMSRGAKADPGDVSAASSPGASPRGTFPAERVTGLRFRFHESSVSCRSFLWMPAPATRGDRRTPSRESAASAAEPLRRRMSSWRSTPTT